LNPKMTEKKNERTKGLMDRGGGGKKDVGAEVTVRKGEKKVAEKERNSSKQQKQGIKPRWRRALGGKWRRVNNPQDYLKTA